MAIGRRWRAQVDRDGVDITASRPVNGDVIPQVMSMTTTREELRDA